MTTAPGHPEHRAARYESLAQGSPQQPSNARMATAPGLAYPTRPERPSDDSVDIEDTMHSDAVSHHSRAQLAPSSMPASAAMHASDGRNHARFTNEAASRSQSREREKPAFQSKASHLATPPALSRQSTGSSWINATAGDRKHPYGQLPGATRSDPNLVFAAGDMPSSSWLRLLASNIVLRWTVYIVPFLCLLWIPGILGETAAKNATVWSVRLLWWSIWLTVVWCGYWGAVAVAYVLPTFLNGTLGVIAPELRHYILYLSNVRRWLALAAWSLTIWITFNPLILAHGPGGDTSVGDSHTLHQIIQGLFGIFVSSCLLLLEKTLVQMIARNFHKKSYADRIQTQKQQIRVLVQLYLYSHDIGRSDTLDNAFQGDPSKYLKKALKGVRNVAQTGATALGAIASEMAGDRVLQPNSPYSMVTSALQSANKSRQLARRIFFSFRPIGATMVTVQDIVHCFATRDEAVEAFNTFDQDGNGDLSMDELEISILEVHRERLGLASSMRDVDSAVSRLDQILMVIWYFAAILIVVSLLNVGFSTLIAGAGTFVLGLSWLIGLSAQEVLASCIFLFIKHPYDVSDRVDIDTGSYIVTEMHLLYTVFKQTDGKIVQIPHSLLNTKVIINIRRSACITEAFKWDVDITTSFEQIEALREDMLAFLEHESRDFKPKMDIVVLDFEGQSKITLSADICYKSNWQNGTLKAQRRNKWIIALKETLWKHNIWGPDQAGNPKPPPADPTVVRLQREEAAPAYTQQHQQQREVPQQAAVPPASPISPGGSDRASLSPAQLARGLSSRHAAIDDASGGDIFSGRGGRRPSLDYGAPRSPISAPLLTVTTEFPGRGAAPVPSTSQQASHGIQTKADEVLEMKERR